MTELVERAAGPSASGHRRATGEELVVRGQNVVNATGVWADQLRPGELLDEAEVPQIRPSRGTHITLDQRDLPLRAGAIVPAGGGRTIFALPWLGRALIGTTDNNYDGPLDRIRPSAERRRGTSWTPSTPSSAPVRRRRTSPGTTPACAR